MKVFKYLDTYSIYILYHTRIPTILMYVGIGLVYNICDVFIFNIKKTLIIIYIGIIYHILYLVKYIHLSLLPNAHNLYSIIFINS